MQRAAAALVRTVQKPDLRTAAAAPGLVISSSIAWALAVRLRLGVGSSASSTPRCCHHPATVLNTASPTLGELRKSSWVTTWPPPARSIVLGQVYLIWQRVVTSKVAGPVESISRSNSASTWLASSEPEQMNSSNSLSCGS